MPPSVGGNDSGLHRAGPGAAIVAVFITIVVVGADAAMGKMSDRRVA